MPSALHQRLEALHVELDGTSAVDASSRQALIALLGDITRLLDKSAPPGAPEQPVAERLEALALGFEAKHPALGTTIRQVVDALGKAGI
jgi:hypothetical protein